MADVNEGIELLYTKDCINWEQALENLEIALKNLDISEDIKKVMLYTQDEAITYKFFASPTVHINGVDIDKRFRNISRRSLGKERPYFYKGKSYSSPPVELIEEALKELL